MEKKKRKDKATTLPQMRDMWLKRKEKLASSVKDKTTAIESLLTGKDKDMFVSLVNDLRDVSDEKCAVRISLESVIDEYEFGSFSIVRCSDCFVWKSFNCRAVVYPSYNLDLSNGGGALYSAMDELCGLAEKDRKHLLSEDGKTEKDILLMLVSCAFTLPVMMFSDSMFAVDVYRFIMNRWASSLEKAAGRLNPETPEDTARNQFMNGMIKEDAEFRGTGKPEDDASGTGETGKGL